MAAISASKPWKRKAKDDGDVKAGSGKKQKVQMVKEERGVNRPKKAREVTVKLEVDELESE